MIRRNSIRATAASIMGKNNISAGNLGAGPEITEESGGGGSNDKNYVWVKLNADGSFDPKTAGTASTNTAQKKRGAPGSLDIWGWAPGFYTTGSKDEGGDATAAGDYRLTLLRLDGDDDDDDGPDGGFSEYTLPKATATKLLDSGDMELANPWEELDFVTRLKLGGDDDDDGESDYDYDDDESDDDDDRPERGGTVSFLDTPEDAPPSNLIELTHLHEAAVVHALRHRFENAGEDMSSIYTDTGPILLAVNPFKRDASGMLYGGATVDKYRIDGEAKWLEERRIMGGGGGGGKKAGAEMEAGPPLPPHVYAVSDRTFRTMMTRLNPLADPGGGGAAADKPAAKAINQSILVSGESGAGKTWTTKLLMAYLSKLSESPDADDNGNDNDNAPGGASNNNNNAPHKSDHGAARRSSFRPVPRNTMSIERRILESNPVMESFGNARTIRNDNSSRFGKYIEMKFLANKKKAAGKGGLPPGVSLVGASIETYLLEKVRLVHQSPGERNYHIFYELFSMKDEEDEDEDEDDDNAPGAVIEKIGITEFDMEDFKLINMSDTYDRRDGVPDEETFADLKEAMKIMGFTRDEMTNVFGVTTAFLHASNLTFETVGEIECRLEMDNPHLDYVVDLLGITKEGLNKALCYYEITIGGRGGKGGETHQKVLSQEQAEKGILALVKATYGALFNHLVARVNASIAGDAGAGGKAKGKGRGAAKGASIGILDIFGFESFLVNSFEQLCINYCNEALQQQFNLFVLRNEQEEYDREGIPWSFIEFPENQDVLDLIAFKGTGILNILHDQCRTPGASDKTFAMAMYNKCAPHKRFEADARQTAEQLFGVHHYAGLVEYDVDGFVEKTRDELPKSGSDLLHSSNNELVKAIADVLEAAAAPAKKKPGARAGGAGQRPTVGIQFSTQLQSLRSKIDATSPHYIRCIKPNNALVPNVFDAALIADQLRCAGVIEAVRVSRLGYPQRFAHTQFISRYQILGRKMKKKANSKKFNPAKALVHSIAQNMPVDQGDDIGIQVGKTKVFLRRSAYDLLEKMRRERIASASVSIQRIGRGFLCKRRYKKASGGIIIIQCFVRKVLATKLVGEMRRQYNSIILQRAWRKYSARNRYLSTKCIARWCQTHYRGSIGRRRYNEFNREVKARYLQAYWRGYYALKSFKTHLNAILTIQCARRCLVARRELSQLKADAKDFANVAKERDILRKEAAALKAELHKLKEESVAAPVQVFDAVADGKKDAEIKSLQSALEQLSKEKESTETELKEVKETLTTLKSERDMAAGALDDIKQVNESLQTKLDSREEELKSREEELNTREEKLRCANDCLEQMQKDLDELKKSKVHLNGSSDVQESSAAPQSPAVQESLTGINTENTQDVPEMVELKDAQVVVLKEELEDLKETNETLQIDNDQLKAENLALTSKTADLAKSIDEMRKNIDNQPTRRLSEMSESQENVDTAIGEESTFAIEEKKSMAIEERNASAINPSVCTSLTADISEEEATKLRDENQMLRKQLSLLRINNEIEFDEDEDYEDSLVGESRSDTSEFIGETSDVPEHVMKQILAEVEIVTEEVIVKTRAESESKIADLEHEIEELKGEMDRSKRLAKYDLDDMTRVNRSLRGELETIAEEKEAIEEELEIKCEEFDALNEDVERFAETFASQHGELQNLETQVKKLQIENEKLRSASADRKKRIGELESQADVKQAVGSELGKLWDELNRLKGASSPEPGHRKSLNRSHDLSDSEEMSSEGEEISSEEDSEDEN